jgi:hypothetical protein
MKITEYPSIEKFKSDNVLLTDGDDGTKIIPITDALLSMLHMSSAKMHRMFYRGKYLGSSLTTTQKSHIQDGTFEDLWIGDYWIINDIKWVIVDFNYWYNTGDTAFTKPHILVMPETPLYNAQMNSTNITTGGYVGSEMYKSNLANAKTIVKAAFGDAVLTHREYLTNAVTNGHPSAGAWYDSSTELPNEPMLFGSYIFTPAGDGSTVVNRYTVSKTQLAIFALDPTFLNIGVSYWTRDVVSSALFALVGGDGAAAYYYASGSLGVRPVTPIG